MHTSEYVEALEAWKEIEQEWRAFLETLFEGQREKEEERKACMEDFASTQKKRGHLAKLDKLYRVLPNSMDVSPNGV